MKVLMTADPIGGVSSYALELIAALAPRGVEVRLATLGGPMPPVFRAELEALGTAALYESFYRLEWMPEPWVDLARAGDWLLELEDEVQPDIVHLNHLVHGDLPWRAPVLIVGHSCVVSWWHAVHGSRPPESWSRYRERVARSLNAADAVVAPTRAMLCELHRHYGPLTHSRVIANGRDSTRFRTARKERVILSAGRLWDAAKNLETLAAAAPEVHWPIVAAGALREPTATAEPGERFRTIRWLGPLNGAELAGWYARAAIYTLPARYEPFGLTPLEAALSGCALVLGDICSLREVWGDAARYVSPNDPCALREALNQLASAPQARTALAARALERARTYAPERMAEAYLELYHELLRSVAEAARPQREGTSVPRVRAHPATASRATALRATASRASASRATAPRVSRSKEHPA